MRYGHLHPSAQAAAEECDEARVRRIRTDRWMSYTTAQTTLAALEDLLQFPKRLRMPNVLLAGPTNNGKTMILDKFRRDHPRLEATAAPEGIARVPVLKVQMPPGPDERRFFGVILDALGLPCSPSERVATRQDAALRLMRLTGVRVLVIDEAHNLLSGTSLQQRRMLNVLRWVGNELQIPLVAAGTAEALRAIQSDEQLANRFKPMTLPAWRDGTEFRRLMATLEAALPLRQASHLNEDALAEPILSRSEGILGEIVAIVSHAAERAILSGSEAITVKILSDADYMAPTARRRVAV